MTSPSQAPTSPTASSGDTRTADVHGPARRPPPGEPAAGDAPTSQQVWQGLRQGLLAGALALAVALPVIHHLVQRGKPAPAANVTAAPLRAADFGDAPATPAARLLAQWVVHTGDNQQQPFALVDKVDARLLIFDAQGRLIGHSPILLGHAAGDRSAPGIGDKPVDAIPEHERTTPAGRFVAQSGRNARGEQVVWVDYHAAVSMHPVLTTQPEQRRLQRLQDPDARQRRISAGCINVPTDFFDQTLWPALGGRPAVVYVLPEVEPLSAFFPQVVS